MKPKLKPIHDQVVVLFGATSGIGLETALHMVEKGAKVAIVGRSQEGLNDAVERVRSHAQTSMMVRNRGNGKERMMGSTSAEMGMGTTSTVAEMEDQVMGMEAEITDFEQVRNVADQVIQRYGRIDTWVNVAAVGEWALFEDTSPDEFRRIIEVNLLGQAYGAMAALPYMKQQSGGAIIFVSSIAGRVPIPYQSAYNASKHGIMGLADTLRQEVRHTRIPVSITTILPASINTPLFDKARTKIGVEPNPIPPIYDAKMVAKAITYAAQHPVRELIVGDSGYAMNFMRRVAPTLTSNAMGATGFRQQRSNEPKSPQAPDNLYQHMAGYNQVDGEYAHRTRQFSPLTWFSTHPKARWAMYALLAGGLLFLFGSRRRQMMRNQSWRQQMAYQTRSMGHKTGALLASLPLISSLPMFHRKTFLEKVSDRISSMGDSISSGLSDRMPYPRQKTFTQRVGDRISDIDVHVPFTHQKTFTERMVDRMPFTHRKTFTERMTERMPFNRPKPLTERMPLYKQRKAVMEKIPSKNDVKSAVDKIAEKTHFVERRETLIAKMPFGERRETVIEKVPLKD